MRRLLYGSEHLDNYVDDVLEHTPTWKEHLSSIRDFLSRVKNAQLSLCSTKCSVGFSNVSYLGHYVGNHSLQTKSDLVEKILQAPKLTNKQQLRSFLGLIGFYRKCIPNFATVAVPLTDLTKKDQPNQLKWGEAQDRAFETLKSYIVNPPILRLSDFEKQFILRTDPSNTGIGAILLQEESGVKHPVAFASRKLLTRERDYSTIEKENVAIVWAIQKFQNFLYGKEFILETDHQPLLFLGKAQYGQNGRLMRWALVLQQYQFTLNAINGPFCHEKEFNRFDMEVRKYPMSLRQLLRQFKS